MFVSGQPVYTKEYLAEQKAKLRTLQTSDMEDHRHRAAADRATELEFENSLLEGVRQEYVASCSTTGAAARLCDVRCAGPAVVYWRVVCVLVTGPFARFKSAMKSTVGPRRTCGGIGPPWPRP